MEISWIRLQELDGLLAAAVIAGADPRRCFGIELDTATAVLCRDRLAKLGVPRSNIKVGDALIDDSYKFEEPAEMEIYFKIEDLGFSKIKIFIERNSNGKSIQKEFIVDFTSDDEGLMKKSDTLYKFFSLADGKKVKIYSEKIENRMKFMNAFFKKYTGRKFERKDCLVDLSI